MAFLHAPVCVDAHARPGHLVRIEILAPFRHRLLPVRRIARILDGDSFRTPKAMPEIDQNRLAQQKTAFLSLFFEIAFREHSDWPHYADHPRLDCTDP
jgi:hypothetical protein